MRRSVLTAVFVLALVSPARADVWEFSWTSDVSGIRFQSVTPGVSDSTTTSHVSGSSLATLTPGGSGGVDIGFSTPAGMAALTIAQPDQVRGTVPGFMPQAPAGTVASSVPGTPGWFLGNVGATGTYTWTGDVAHPETFQVRTVGPGSGPAVEVAFAGLGRLVQGPGAPLAQASEPDLAVLCVGAFAVTLVARLRRV